MFITRMGVQNTCSCGVVGGTAGSHSQLGRIEVQGGCMLTAKLVRLIDRVELTLHSEFILLPSVHAAHAATAPLNR